MKHEYADYHRRITDSLRRLPRKMLLGMDNVTEFVLHELCSNSCFDLEKAAYFIDNPDFNCLKGVAGFCRDEALGEDDIWNSPDTFSKKMASSSFNKKVRMITSESCKRHGTLQEDFVRSTAHELGFNDIGVYTWDMKHDNHGIFICEKSKNHFGESFDDMIIDGLSLLAFCPVH